MDIPPASFTEGRTVPRRYTVLSAPQQSLADAMGLPPETRLIDTGLCSATTIRGGRRWVQVQYGTTTDASTAMQARAPRSKVALAIVPRPVVLSENQHQQPDDYQKTNQKNDTDSAPEKLEHEDYSFGWVHLLRLGYRRIVQSPAAKADG